MTLRDYLDSKEETATALAVRLGVSHSSVLRWADKTLRPSVRRLPQIVAATKGKVTAAELRPDLASAFGKAA